MAILCGILIVAAVATTGDYLWYTLGVRHNITNGVVMARAAHRRWRRARYSVRTHREGPAHRNAGRHRRCTGLLRDRRPYRRIRYGAAIPAAWLVLWLLLAVLDGRWLRAPALTPWSEVAVRGALAALLASIAFALVMQTLWGRPPAGGRNYLLQFAAWILAWTPGILILTTKRPGRLAGRTRDDEHAP